MLFTVEAWNGFNFSIKLMQISISINDQSWVFSFTVTQSFPTGVLTLIGSVSGWPFFRSLQITRTTTLVFSVINRQNRQSKLQIVWSFEWRFCLLITENTRVVVLVIQNWRFCLLITENAIVNISLDLSFDWRFRQFKIFPEGKICGNNKLQNRCLT